MTSISKVRRAFDVNSFAQAAALASLDAPDELARRRAVNAEGLVQLERIMREHGLEPPPVGRELPLRRGRRGLTPALRAAAPRGRDRPPGGRLRRPGAIRVTVGTPEENELFGEALGRVLSAAAQT